MEINLSYFVKKTEKKKKNTLSKMSLSYVTPQGHVLESLQKIIIGQSLVD
jgi:hypothetical protein